MSKQIDYLNEDIPINGQTVALISIIGPHMKQKCDTWAIKIKGTASSEEEADKMGKRLNALDPDIDIFRVPVGKFFPLSIDPASADNTIYQNEQLNDLVKQNKLNSIHAKDHFEQRKEKMMEDALREGKDQSSSTEHPVALLDRVNTTENRIKELTEEMKSLQDTLNITELKFNKLSVEEKEKATDEFNKINGTTTEEIQGHNLVEETPKTEETPETEETPKTEETPETDKVKETNNFINESFKDSKYNGMF